MSHVYDYSINVRYFLAALAGMLPREWRKYMEWFNVSGYRGNNNSRIETCNLAMYDALYKNLSLLLLL